MSAVHRSVGNVMVLLQRPDDGKVLTVRHQATSWHSPGMLTVIGGRLEAGEFLTEGAARELAEEVGIHVAPDLLQFSQLHHFHAVDGERVIGIVFTAPRWEGIPCNREPDTHVELVWVDPAAPPADCHPFTHAVFAHFVSAQLYGNVTAPELLGGEDQ
ncbi:NUDIX domain-containing protein [Streptomyces sp. NPDC048270]|uniref:NUDIX domain-containing protein n=1 Tax=Streptomyces sp. NPDC048270 TaxID=3154615 RepID=UPI0033D10D6B